MKIDILTLFPEMFNALDESILGRAQEKSILQINIVNIRDFSANKHKKVDDTPFGGGAGMLMTPQPLYDAIMSVKTDNAKIVYMSPKGATLNQEIVCNFSNCEHIIIVCGHYEGIDQRIIDLFDMEEISIGDYILTGGELPAMVFIDCVSRYVEGVLGHLESVKEESFASGKLEYPQYTKPREFMGLKVPDVLLSGNHEEIKKWRENESKNITRTRRPDLLD